MGIDVTLYPTGVRQCNATIKKYLDGPKKGQYGTCIKEICLAEITPGKRDWQPFIKLPSGEWINHFEDCPDAELFGPAYRKYVQNYKPKPAEPKTLNLLDQND